MIIIIYIVLIDQARKAIPTSPIIWFTSAQLEEANGSTNRVDTLIKRCITSMVDNHVCFDLWSTIPLGGDQS